MVAQQMASGLQTGPIARAVGTAGGARVACGMAQPALKRIPSFAGFKASGIVPAVCCQTRWFSNLPHWRPTSAEDVSGVRC
jgi:hypothetical protein